MADEYLSPAARDLQERMAALAEAEARLQSAEEQVNERRRRATLVHRNPEPTSPAAMARLQSDAAAAADEVSRAHAAAYFSQERQPAAVYARIAADAKGITAPNLSAFQWIAKNPGFLTSSAKWQPQRDEEARQDFILTRLNEEAAKAKYPFSLYDDDATAELAMAAAQYAGRPEIQAAVRSPYRYFISGDNTLPAAASLGERAGLAAADAVSRAIGPEHSIVNAGLGMLSRPQHFATGFRAAGQRLAEGNPYGAAMGVGQALVSPFFPETAVNPAEFHKYSSPAASTAINMALDPTWYYGAGAAKTVDRLRYGPGVRAFLEDAAGNTLRRLPNAPGGKIGPLLLR